MRNLKLLLKNRIVLFIAFILVFIIASKVATGNFLPSTDTKDLWFYSGIFMVLFSTLFIEPYYSSPKNVITNIIPLLLVFVAIQTEFTDLNQWWVIVGILLTLLIVSVLAMTLKDDNKSPGSRVNVMSNRLKNIAVLFGKGKVLYSGIFLYFLFTYILTDQTLTSYVYFLLILWAFLLLVNPKDLTNSFPTKQKKVDDSAIGEVFSVQSKKIFLVRIFENKKALKRFEIVKFRYSMDDGEKLITGIVFDYYLLNQEKWAKVLQLGLNSKKKGEKLTKNTIYKVAEDSEKLALKRSMRVDELVGVVIEKSKIARIKFEYSKKKDDLQEGDLLELVVGKRKMYYQTLTGETGKEVLEARNESGLIVGEAIQLGEWDNNDLSFKKFGWVPEMSTPVFTANTSSITPPTFNYPNFKVGTIPGTSLPSVINLHDAINSHMALLGITGSGKSFLAREIIKELQTDTKVICVDFTSEWSTSTTGATSITEDNIDSFLEDESSNFGILELPDVSNTTDALKKTQGMFEKIFNHAKSQYEAGETSRICLVLEEAHTITPETSFLGDMGDYGSNKALVNKMSQIALQGRKYGVGLLIIAQRTANVSKTVLTQCNTVICFQAYDETSYNFLGNYVGKDMIEALPNLKKFHAVVTGKAVKSNVPMIVNLEREKEE